MTWHENFQKIMNAQWLKITIQNVLKMTNGEWVKITNDSNWFGTQNHKWFKLTIDKRLRMIHYQNITSDLASQMFQNDKW